MLEKKKMARKPELGQLLVEDGLITPAQLQEAVHNQVIFGGRLGSNLLELGYIDEETLARYLARQHKVKTLRLEDISRIQPGLNKLIPKKLAEKHQVVPFRLDDKKLYVIMANPSEMGALSELSFVTGKIIVPLVLPEVRVFELLNRYYNIGRELRYINIAMLEAERRNKRVRTIAKISPVKMLAEPSPKEEFKKKLLEEGVSELIDEQEFEKLTAGYYQQQVEKEKAPIAPDSGAKPVSQSPPEPKPASLSEPSPRPQPRAGEQPYRQVAHKFYRELLKAELDKIIPTKILQDFLKNYVLHELKNFVLPLKQLANFLSKEVGLNQQKLDQLIENISKLESELGIMLVKPGEEIPLPQKPAASEEIVELEELVELVPISEEAPVEYLPEPELIPEEAIEEAEPEIAKLSFEQATKELMEKTKDRDELARAVLGFAKGFFKRAVLFTVRAEQVFGWYGFGSGITFRQVQKILIPLNEPSVFKTVVDASCHYLGPLMELPENQKFLSALGGAKPNSVFLIPIIWQAKVVYILYGDNGDGENVPFDIGELLILAQKLPLAIQHLIEEKKKQYQLIQGGKQ